MIIDTHMHIYDDKYVDKEKVIKNALDNGIEKMIVIGYDKESSLKALELSKKYDFIYLAVGLHPSEVQKETDTDLTWLTDILDNEKVIAIGEVGLDYYWDKTYIEEQKYFFKKQIELSKKYNLPLIIHNRDAMQDTFDIIKDEKVRGVLHCYGGSYEMAKELTKRGWYLGIGGVVTFKNAKTIKEVVEKIDLKYLLTETDSPYLAPTPHRGELNEPAYTKYVLEEIAKIKGIDVKEVEKQVEENVYDLFGI